MSNIPDFAQQILAVQQMIEARSSVTAEDWSDPVQERYYNRFIKRYSSMMELYIHGGADMAGLGINKLMEFLGEKLEQMSELTGISADTAFDYAANGSEQ